LRGRAALGRRDHGRVVDGLSRLIVVLPRMTADDRAMPPPAADAIAAAAKRLSGQLVQTPLLGGLLLPGDTAADVRLWPDQLQCGGSMYYRGFVHFLLRQMGACKALTFAGTDRRAAAAAVAAAGHRLLLSAYLVAPPRQGLAELLARCGAEWHVVADPVAAADQRRRSEGATVLPGPENADVAAGLATSGLELAAQMPRDGRAVYAPLELADTLAAGLAAGGIACRVVGVATAAAAPTLAPLQQALVAAHRLHCESSGLATLAAAMRHPESGVAIAVIAE
jgi:threonine dehydratase